MQHALMGVRGIICALMLNTVLTLAKKSLIHPICVGICVAAFVLMRIPKLKQLHPGLWILAAAVVGVIFRL